MTFRCPSCGEMHDGVPLVWGPNAPDAVQGVPDHERRRRVILGTDICIIDRREYFIRACLDLRVSHDPELFRWLVWVKVSEASMKEFMSIWRRLWRRPIKPTDASLANRLPYDEPTLGLQVQLRDAGSGYRPKAIVQSADHILGREQRSGINLERAYELAGRALHAQR